MPGESRHYDVICETDAELRLRDGVILRADVYRPVAQGDFPVLVCRTPYDKSLPLNGKVGREVAERGFVTVIQDIRGTCRSEGEFNWIFGHPAQETEGPDGYETVEWAARLAKSDGRVGIYGVSYNGYTSWRAAGEKPPSLKAMHVAGAISQSHRHYGILETGRRLQWTYMMAADQRRRAGRTDGAMTVAAANKEWLQHQRYKWMWHLPLDTIPDYVFGPLTPQLKTLLREQAHQFYDFEPLHVGFDIPVCIVTGWWDRNSSCCETFRRLRELGDPEVRDQHRLISGPWSHHPFEYRRGIGESDYGPEADYPYSAQIADWFDFQFKNVPGRIGSGPPVHLFLVNDNTWKQFDTWPPKGSRQVPYYLHSEGSANSARGDGVLSPDAPRDETPDHYVYDPSDPYMSVMGPESQYYPCDHRVFDYRVDNLVFQTPPFEKPTLLIGDVRCFLWAASDALDTDFAVKLIEVAPDGTSFAISEGILRARFREGYDRQVMLEPGKPTLFEIHMLPICIRMRPGSRIRLDIASSDFPAFDRNHNTGGDDWASAELRVANQTVFHDDKHPTHVLLPIMEEG